MRGTLASNALVYSCRGSARILRVGPVSTMRTPLQDDDLLAQRGNDTEVVRHEDQRHVAPTVRLNSSTMRTRVERSSALTASSASSSAGSGGDGAGDGDALALAAGELVRIAAEHAAIEADRFERRLDHVRGAAPECGASAAVRTRCSGRSGADRARNRGPGTPPGLAAGNSRMNPPLRGIERRAVENGCAPVVGRSSPSSRRSRVVLPEPDSPTSPRLAPATDGEADVIQHAGARGNSRS